MKTQKFGIEIELTGITRKKVADVIAEYFGTEKFYIGTYYQTYGAKDHKGRTWKATFDSSIIAQRKKNGRKFCMETCCLKGIGTAPPMAVERPS